MLGLELLKTWEGLAPDPVGQLTAVREYASRVLGSELSAAAWLGQANPSILDGTCLVSEACESRAGFQAAMLELVRISTTMRNSLGDAMRDREPPTTASTPHPR